MLNRLINAALVGNGVENLFHTTYKGIKYMSLCANFLSEFPSDAIYVNGKKMETISFDLSSTPLANINLDTVNLSQSPSLFSNYYVIKLEKFKEDDLYYKFNEVYISRNKVLRNINILLKNNMLNEQSLLYAITKDSILTNEQYQKVLECINHVLHDDKSDSKGGI